MGGDNSREEKKQLEKQRENERIKEQGELEERKEIAQQKADSDKRRHENQMKEHEKQMKELGLKDKKEQRVWYNNQMQLELKQQEKANKESEQLQQGVEDLDAEIKLNGGNVEQLNAKRNDELQLLNDNLQKAKEGYKTNDDLVQKAIESTNVIAKDIPQFLNLINNGLLFSTLNGAISRDRLQAKIKGFSASMTVKTEDQLPISSILKDRYEPWAQILAKEDYTMMDDILCDDMDEVQDIIDMLNKGLPENDKEKNVTINDDEKKEQALISDKLSKRERKAIEKFCLRSKAENGWLKKQKEKQDGIRATLLETSPILSKFFGVINIAMNDAQKLLSYNHKLNTEQLQAIESGKEPQIEQLGIEYVQQEVQESQIEQQLAIEFVPEVQQPQIEQKQVDDDENNIDLNWKIGSNCEIYSDSEQKWKFGKIIEITNDSEGEWLTVAYDNDTKTKQIQPLSEYIRLQQDHDDIDDSQQNKDKSSISIINDEVDDDDSKQTFLENDDDFKKKEDEYLASKKIVPSSFHRKEMKESAADCEAINNAAIINLHVVESLKNEFQGGKLAITKATAFTLAENVEDCCLEIIQTQGVIRQSVMLAQQLLDYKPAQPTDEAAKLWKAVGNGITEIYMNALSISSVSVEYFGFFMKFKEAFEYFRSLNEQNPNVSLDVALEHLHRSTADFFKFQIRIQEGVTELRENAKNIIGQCVASTAGASHVQNALTTREEEARNIENTQKKIMRTKYSLDQKYETSRKEQVALIANRNVKQFELENIKKSISERTRRIEIMGDKLKDL